MPKNSFPLNGGGSISQEEFLELSKLGYTLDQISNRQWGPDIHPEGISLSLPKTAKNEPIKLPPIPPTIRPVQAPEEDFLFNYPRPQTAPGEINVEDGVYNLRPLQIGRAAPVHNVDFTDTLRPYRPFQGGFEDDIYCPRCKGIRPGVEIPERGFRPFKPRFEPDNYDASKGLQPFPFNPNFQQNEHSGFEIGTGRVGGPAVVGAGNVGGPSLVGAGRGARVIGPNTERWKKKNPGLKLLVNTVRRLT